MTAENSNSNSNREGLCLELSNKPSPENIVEDFMLNDNRDFVLELDMDSFILVAALNQLCINICVFLYE
jgi:hypothetical protein